MSRSKMILISIGVTFGVIALLGIKQLSRSFGVAWAETEGTVSKWELTLWKSTANRPVFDVQVTYSYAVDGRAFESERPTQQGDLRMNPDTISDYFGSMEPQTVKVYYDPEDPEYAFLVKPNRVFQLIIVSFSALVSVVCLIRGLLW